MKLLPLTLLTCLLTLVLNAQDISVSQTPTSCQGVCDGTATFIGLDFQSTNTYEWKSDDSLRYTKLNSAKIKGLCSGVYFLKILKLQEIGHQEVNLTRESADGFVHLKYIKLNTRGVRDVDMKFNFPKEFDDPNYYLTAFYSLDNGETWRQINTLFQEPKSGEKNKVQHVFELPRKSNNRAEVLIDLQQRNPKGKNGTPLLNLIDFKVEGRSIQKIRFDIENNDPLEIRSLVSNEMDGRDGYISLNVSGGKRPYTYSWEDGRSSSEIRNLVPGTYTVEVRDKLNCQDIASFEVLKGGASSSIPYFGLEQSESTKYVLTIKNLFRQPMHLKIRNMDAKEVKSYTINPLYEDLSMILDLSFLNSGNYKAELIGTRFKESVSFIID